jgi:hypothetical protein
MEMWTQDYVDLVVPAGDFGQRPGVRIEGSRSDGTPRGRLVVRINGQ